MISTNDFRIGTTILFKNEVWQVQEFMHVKPGKGSPMVQTRLKNLRSSEVLRVVFRAGEKLAEAQIETSEFVYIYFDGTRHVFMDHQDSLELTSEDIGPQLDLLKPGQMGIQIARTRDAMIMIELPKMVELCVTDTAPDVRGNTACGKGKKATLQTGATVIVPFHVESGDVIRINTRTRTYVCKV